MSARMRHSEVSILAVSGSQGARLRGASGRTGPRGKEIYCQTGGAPGAGIAHSIFCSQMNYRALESNRVYSTIIYLRQTV